MASVDVLKSVADALMHSKIEFTEEEKSLVGHAISSPEAGVTAISAMYSSKLLVDALEKHATALSEAAAASDRYTRSLTYATWVLAAATVALVLAALLPLIPR